LICSAEQFVSLTLPTFRPVAAVRLLADLDLRGFSPLLPIGTDSRVAILIFDGNGKTISHLSYTKTDGSSHAGLFGTLRGAVKRLALVDAKIQSNAENAGMLVGSMLGLIIDSHVHGSVSGAGRVGAISGTVDDFSAVVSSYAEGFATSTAGAAAGVANTGVVDSFAVTTVDAFANGGPITAYRDACEAFVSDNSFFSADAACRNCCSVEGGVPASAFFLKTQAPLDRWDFERVWKTSGTAYPALR
jgi:hypothetical protein